LETSTDTGLLGVVLLARCHGVAAEPAGLRHRFGMPGQPFGLSEIRRALRGLGLKSRIIHCDWARLGRLPLPALVPLRDGGFAVMAAVAGDEVLLQVPGQSRPTTLNRQRLCESWDGSLLLVTRRGALAGDGERFGLGWFLPALRRYRRLLAEVLLASFCIQMLALVTPLFFQVVIDKVLVHQRLATLDVLALGLLLVVVFEVLLAGMRSWLFAHTGGRVDVELGAQLYRHLQDLPVAFFLSRPVGAIVARVRELEGIRNFITGATLTLLLDLFFSVVFFVVMFAYSPALAWVVLATLPLYGALAAIVAPLLRHRLDDQFRRGAENQSFLVEAVAGAETVKSLAVEPHMQRRWEEQLAGYVAASLRATNLGNVAAQSAALVSRTTTVLILWLGARLVIDQQLSVGQLVAFNMLAGRVSGPILRLVQLWQEFQQARISLARLGEILNLPAEPGSGPVHTDLPPIAGRVSFEQVTFRYGSGQPEALRDVSLEVAAGEIIGIVGRSGCGKSTLARLIQRLYVPERGRVRIDGTDLSLADPAWLRRQVGVVPQESRLFHRSVRDNIALADPGLPLEAILRAAQLAGAHDFIVALPQGYDTLIGEHGANLSGGQRQRIAIARALVTNPRILILDEATSALDYESERVIQDNLRAIARGRTVFIIAHRLSALRAARRILVLDRGVLAEQGTHDELVARRGPYALLYQDQAA